MSMDEHKHGRPVAIAIENGIGIREWSIGHWDRDGGFWRLVDPQCGGTYPIPDDVVIGIVALPPLSKK